MYGNIVIIMVRNLNVDTMFIKTELHTTSERLLHHLQLYDVGEKITQGILTNYIYIHSVNNYWESRNFSH